MSLTDKKLCNLCKMGYSQKRLERTDVAMILMTNSCRVKTLHMCLLWLKRVMPVSPVHMMTQSVCGSTFGYCKPASEKKCCDTWLTPLLLVNTTEACPTLSRGHRMLNHTGLLNFWSGNSRKHSRTVGLHGHTYSICCTRVSQLECAANRQCSAKNSGAHLGSTAKNDSTDVTQYLVTLRFHRTNNTTVDPQAFCHHANDCSGGRKYSLNAY